jgi:CDP-diacylglycerol--glycerol-3-phosphate 3-phosphatidyltransferase
MKINVATQLTLLRLVLVPFFMIFTIIDNMYTRIAALIIFILASLTDLYDGKLARQRGEVTTLGVFLDPLADKFLISSAFIAFVQMEEINVPAWMVVLIIGREFFITGLRTVAAAKGRILPAQPAGKFKTTSQIVAIIVIMLILIANNLITKLTGLPVEVWGGINSFRMGIRWILQSLPYWLTLVTTALTIISGFIYINNNIDLFHEER